MHPFLAQLAGNRFRRITCEPHPRRWRSFCQQHALEWQSLPFRKGAGAALPSAAGFYCFYVGNPPNGLPLVLYPLYAGETGDLRRRYRDYVREKNDPEGRNTIREMLIVFSGEVRFAYAAHDVDRSERLQIEKQLNNALMPYYGVKDFSAEIKRERRPWP